MALTHEQIERYSRQLIVGEMGGVAQQRLLASTVLLASDLERLEPVLYYLVGAGVGRLELRPAEPGGDRARILAHARALNPDVAITADDEPPRPAHLAALFIGSAASRALAQALCARGQFDSAIITRLDHPAAITILDTPPPPELLRPFTRPAAVSDLVTMVAATEILKTLAGITDHSGRRIDFDGYAARLAAPRTA